LHNTAIPQDKGVPLTYKVMTTLYVVLPPPHTPKPTFTIITFQALNVTKYKKTEKIPSYVTTFLKWVSVPKTLL
jgi:hypothetical protein